MVFNYEKCKVMHFQKNRKTIIKEEYGYTIEIKGTIDRHRLEINTNERDLGIQITNDLKWSTQAKTAASKANAVLGTLKRQWLILNSYIIHS